MNIMTDTKIKFLFIRIFFIIIGFGVISTVFVITEIQNSAIYIMGGSFVMGIGILFTCFRYFKEENKIMEEAVKQVREYISGNSNARIESNEEGGLYRLFHEVNSLAAILNAHAENEVKSKKFLENIISDISHQLKTPLAALNIYNGIIQTEAETKDYPTVTEFSHLSEQELDRIETLVQSLLKIAKFDAGAIIIEKHSENISEMMEDIKKQFSFRAEQEGKSIVLSGNESLLFLCDRSWILEAVGNLVKNALDHTKNGDCVWIEWGQFASIIQITVKDNGSGVHPQDLHHIFKRFYRSRYSKDTQGIGLGLPLAKSAVEAHNGTIEVDSELEKGTTFILNFLTCQESPSLTGFEDESDGITTKL